MKTSTEIYSIRPVGVLSLLVVNNFTSRNLALPHLVTEQRVAPSGEIRVLQNNSTIKSIFSVGMHVVDNTMYVLSVC